MGKRLCLILALFLGLAGCPVLRGPAYFVVSEREPVYGDSYLLVLNEPDDIRQRAPACGRPIQHDAQHRGGQDRAREWESG